MYMTVSNIKLYRLFQIISLFIINGVTGTITGLNYMEPIVQKEHTNNLPGENPCNPLYWYPREIPDYCNFKIPPKPKITPISVPIPVPMPMPPPPPPPPPPMYPVPIPVPVPVQVPARMPMIPGMPLIPQSFPVPPLPLPYGLPLAPSGPIIPVPGFAPGMQNFYQNYGPFGGMAGLMPGIEGMVSRDGGINVLPFSDAYSDLIEKHKNKMIRKKMKQLIKDYDREFSYKMGM